MGWTQIGLLGGMAGVAIPIVIHLMFRMRAQTGRPGNAAVPENGARRQRTPAEAETLDAAGAAHGLRGPAGE